MEHPPVRLPGRKWIAHRFASSDNESDSSSDVPFGGSGSHQFRRSGLTRCGDLRKHAEQVLVRPFLISRHLSQNNGATYHLLLTREEPFKLDSASQSDRRPAFSTRFYIVRTTRKLSLAAHHHSGVSFACLFETQLRICQKLGGESIGRWYRSICFVSVPVTDAMQVEERTAPETVKSLSRRGRRKRTRRSAGVSPPIVEAKVAH